MIKEKIRMLLLITFIIFIVFLLTLIILNDPFNRKRYKLCETFSLPSKPNHKPLKVAILLTAYISNDNERAEMYEKNIKRWINDTNLNIFLVDSSNVGSKLKNSRFKQYVFDQKEKFGSSSTILEKKSILGALYYFKKDFSKYDIIFKVTGKYFIPDFNNIVKYIPSDAKIIVQHSASTSGQNTELFGATPRIMKEIVSDMNTDIFEEHLYKIICKGKYKIYRFPKFKLDQRIKRGDGFALRYL